MHFFSLNLINSYAEKEHFWHVDSATNGQRHKFSYTVLISRRNKVVNIDTVKKKGER